jgi:hypothetical protein
MAIVNGGMATYDRPTYDRDSVTVAHGNQEEPVERPNASAMLDSVCNMSQQLLPRLNQLLGRIENQNYGEPSHSNPVPQPVQTINIRLMNACDNVNEAHQILNAIEAALGV